MMCITLSTSDTNFQLKQGLFDSIRLRCFPQNHIYFLEEGKCLSNNIEALGWGKNSSIKRLDFD